MLLVEKEKKNGFKEGYDIIFPKLFSQYFWLCIFTVWFLLFIFLVSELVAHCKKKKREGIMESPKAISRWCLQLI